MNPLATFADARMSLDGLARDIEKKLRLNLDIAEAEMERALEGLDKDRAVSGGNRTVAGAIRDCVENAALSALHSAHALGVADLVRSVLPRRPFSQNSKTGRVLTRNPVTKAGKLKPFPSDRQGRELKREKSKRQRYRARVLGVHALVGGQPDGVPKRAKLGTGKPGRPKMPPEWHAWKARVKSARYLAKRRAQTAARLAAMGKPPRHRRASPMGWADAAPFEEAAKNAVRDQRLDAEIHNGAEMVTRQERARAAWRKAHEP